MNDPEKEYLDRFWESQANYLELLAKLPDGVHPIPIHSLKLLHFSCQDQESLANTLSRSPDLWQHLTGFRLISMGTRHYSTKPADIATLIALKNQIDPPNT